MKKLLLFMLLLLPLGVYAATDSSANNWKIYCDRTQVTQGDTAKCYLLTQIKDAVDGGRAITAIMTGISGDKMEVKDSQPAFDTITLTKTLHTNSFSGSLVHSSEVCNAVGGCYDFTADEIKSNTTLDISNLTGNIGYTPIGYWEIELDEDSITPDSDECARVCIDVDYLLSGSNAPVVGVNRQTSNANGTCQELKLVSRNVCKIDNGKYYGKDGSEVTEAEYKEQCEPKICKIENDKYYDNNGNEVTEEEYKKACTCRIDNGKYYDNDGNEVTKEEYSQKCTCRIENDKYYDGNGNEVTKEEYTKRCTCRKTSDGKYYGRDGSEITKEQYDKDCVPATGSFASYAVLAAGALIALSAITIAKKHNKFYKV